MSCEVVTKTDTVFGSCIAVAIIYLRIQSLIVTLFSVLPLVIPLTVKII